ncbi:hypothetical protein EIP91_006831 [Steccherinum ochraceum]|uniref:MYND-type domain-containing protein n=1 Tax=Steccherinum ochraceum TaxID=92696 RepID=A0A4R0R524_9APHY|nr:hypothetical protein EIP91_006831 [Steccherinum ochraceum]
MKQYLVSMPTQSVQSWSPADMARRKAKDRSSTTAVVFRGTPQVQQDGDGGLKVTREMYEILAQPGYLSTRQRSQRLRAEYQRNAMRFDPTRLSPFALDCFTGAFEEVRKVVEDKTAPDLKGSETAYKFGYVAFVVMGAQRLVSGPNMQHVPLLKYLLQAGAPPDVEDIVGYTALNHITMQAGSDVRLARILLENGADPNHRTRYGAIPILDCFTTNQVDCADLLMEFGSDLSIADADGVVPSSLYLQAGPRIAAVVAKWLMRRNGEDAPLDDTKRCQSCGRIASSLKQCNDCHMVRYCSAECQRNDWPKHKESCRPFDETNTVALRPRYNSGIASTISPSDVARAAMGIPTQPPSSRSTRAALAPPEFAYPKSVIIKVQVPLSGWGGSSSTGDSMIYTKKRDLSCVVSPTDDRDAYLRISEVVKEKGIGGVKAYFAAELLSKDELVVKIDAVLAPQPF